MEHAAPPVVTFRCPLELRNIIPHPIPAVLGLPDWYKILPQRAFNSTLGSETETLKRCPPFIDAMTYGFFIPLVTDLSSPISFHDPSQIAGTPFCDDDRFIIKFNNFWIIEAPPGYSLLFTHPINRPELPFTTLAGLVDCDTFNHTPVHFPARWHDTAFNGVLPKGTPIVQCLPVRRESWTGRVEDLSTEALARHARTGEAIAQTPNVYRREFRAPKR